MNKLTTLSLKDRLLFIMVHAYSVEARMCNNCTYTFLVCLYHINFIVSPEGQLGEANIRELG